MAKKVTGYIKLQIPAGKATPAPPVGPALSRLLSQYMLIEVSALLQRLRRQQFF